jgi:SecD/SecF fusion protein
MEREGTTIIDQVATKLYNRASSGDIERALGIFLDSTMLSYPQINQATYGSSAQIEGNFTPQEVEELANLLKSGSLPIPLEKPPLYQETISATLGANFIDMAWKAGLIGIARL